MRELDSVETEVTKMHATVRSGAAFLYFDYAQCVHISSALDPSLEMVYCSSVRETLEVIYSGQNVDLLIADERSGGWDLLLYIRKSDFFHRLPLIMLVDKITPENRKRARDLSAGDIFPTDLDWGNLALRAHYFTVQRKKNAGNLARKHGNLLVRMPWWKRSFDLLVVGFAVLLLLPVYLAVALLIRFDSKGPVFYRSQRVGCGYRIFDLYKFRTMRVNADKLIKDMSALNSYQKSDAGGAESQYASLCPDCAARGLAQCEQLLFLDGLAICERVYHRQKENEVAFMKFRNDPRITRIGAFLRNTSLDELPQFINILKGDMSLVGNRPLPLYEAEKLTTDDKIIRFAAPAGLTGLWQVTKRGKKEMSEEERIQLDVEYARNFSLWMDLKIVWRTFPALFQSENV